MILMKTRSEKMREKALEIGREAADLESEQDGFQFVDNVDFGDWDGDDYGAALEAFAREAAEDLVSGNKGSLLDWLDEFEQLDGDPSAWARDTLRRARRLRSKIERFRRAGKTDMGVFR